MTICKVKDNMYAYEIYLILNCNGKEFKDYVDKKYKVDIVEPGKNGCHLTLAKNKRLVHIIWLEYFNWKITHQALLVHELLHLIVRILRDIGMDMADESEEAYTYYLQEIYSESLIAIHKNLPAENKVAIDK